MLSEFVLESLRAVAGVCSGVAAVYVCATTLKVVRDPRCWYRDASGHKRLRGYIPSD